jgi:hypothetical protein
MGRALLYGLPPAALWAAAVGKLPALRRDPHNPRVRAYWLALVALALAITVLRPPWGTAPTSTIEVRQLPRLVGHSLVLVNLCAVEAFLAYSVYPKQRARARVQRRMWALAAAVVVMAIAFTVGSGRSGTVGAVAPTGTVTPFLVYWLAFYAYLGVALVNMTRLNLRWARQTDREVLQLGLRLTAAGALCGLTLLSYALLYLAADQLGWPPRHLLGDQPHITQLLLAATVLLVVIGTTMPAWGPRVGLPSLLRWAGRYRAHRRLYPLWRDLCQAVPDVALMPPTGVWRDRLRLRRLEFWLHRRVIEIRDARLALRPYLDPEVAGNATELGRQAGLDGEELHALVEAATLAAAMHASRTAQARAAAGEPMAAPGGADLDAHLESEMAWLGKVADAYRRSPLVRAVVASRQAPQSAATQRPESLQQP